MDTAGRAREILVRLRTVFPDPRPALAFASAYELLVATVLAAQCTDARVNKVTPEFFRRWPDPAALSRATAAAVEEVIHSTGFFRQKAKNLVAAAKLLVERHDGAVPASMVSTLGNHEFDRGVPELRRQLDGGNAADGPFLENPWKGAAFPYVCANVVDSATKKPLLPPYVIKKIGKIPVAFIGAVVRTTPRSTMPTTRWIGIPGVKKPSRRPGPRTNPFSSLSVTPPATGVTSCNKRPSPRPAPGEDQHRNTVRWSTPHNRCAGQNKHKARPRPGTAWPDRPTPAPAPDAGP